MNSRTFQMQCSVNRWRIAIIVCYGLWHRAIVTNMIEYVYNVNKPINSKKYT